MAAHIRRREFIATLGHCSGMAARSARAAEGADHRRIGHWQYQSGCGADTAANGGMTAMAKYAAARKTTRRPVVPKPVPAGAIVVAANAGSDYLFVPDHNLETVRAAVTSLQSRLQFGAIFVSDRYGEIAGSRLGFRLGCSSACALPTKPP